MLSTRLLAAGPKARRGFHKPWLEMLEDRLTPSSTHFAVIGDYGNAGQAELDVSNLVKSWTPDYIVTLGDNNYPNGAQSTIDGNIGRYYHDYIGNYQGSFGAGSATNRFFPVLGNHDWIATNATPYLNYFTLPGNERYYDFTQGPVEFFVVDSDPHEPDGTDPGSTQGLWLQNELAASSATYKLVLFHHPPYASDQDQSTWMRWPFQAWGATAVLSGHAHNYERLIEDNNFPYFVNGLGGTTDLQDFTTPVPGSLIRYNADFGALLVNADDTQISFQFYERNGTLLDSYSMAATHSTALVSAGSAWKYLDNGSNQGTAWIAPGFSDAGWQSGPAQLGYGDGDEQTVVGYGPNASSKYITTYFRRSFNVAATSFSDLSLSLLRDDGAVVYLNGTEVYRSNMPGGTIGYQTLASAAVSGAEESQWFQTGASPALLVPGNNVLAVEIHQSSASSTDISFDLSLIGSGSVTSSTPPQVATAASATLNAAGTQAQLGVLGADDGGEGNLIYTWSVVSKPAGAANPTFSINGTNGAKNAVATFSLASSTTPYVLRATITDQNGQSVTSDATVTVTPMLKTITVTPAAVTLAPGAGQLFSASGKDQFGAALATQPTFVWSLDSGGVGSINSSSGQYAAPSSGTGFATVRATSGSISGTASVTVTVTAGPVFAVNSGGAAASPFAADSGFSGGNTYSTTAAISTTGVTSPAPQAVYQTERYGDFTYSAGNLTAGGSYTVRLHFAEIYFSSPNQRLFNVSINGIQVLTGFDIFAQAGAINKAIVKEFTATADGSGKIAIQFVSSVNNAKVSGIEVLATGASNPPPTVATVASATLNAAGTQAQLGVLGADDGGESNLIYTWSVVSKPAGATDPTFSANGTNAAKNAVVTFSLASSTTPYVLRATITDQSGQSVTSNASVTVTPILKTITVTPATVTLAPGGGQLFSASGKDQFGATLATQPTFVWSVDSGGVGSINSSSGQYAAPLSGSGNATVRATSGSISGTAPVTVTATVGPVFAVNAGGGAAGSFAADSGFSGGSTYSTTTAISTTGVTNPAPQAVYQSERYGNFTYTAASLTPGATYTVRLHFAELYWSSTGQRVFNVNINGTQVLSNFDIVAQAGGANKAIVKQFTATADSTGKIAIQFVSNVDNAKVSGIEILS